MPLVEACPREQSWVLFCLPHLWQFFFYALEGLGIKFWCMLSIFINCTCALLETHLDKLQAVPGSIVQWYHYWKLLICPDKTQEFPNLELNDCMQSNRKLQSDSPSPEAPCEVQPQWQQNPQPLYHLLYLINFLTQTPIGLSEFLIKHLLHFLELFYQCFYCIPAWWHVSSNSFFFFSYFL